MRHVFAKIRLPKFLRSSLKRLFKILSYRVEPPQNLNPLALLFNQDQFGHILDILPIGIAVMYPDGNFRYLNQTAKTLFKQDELPNLFQNQISPIYSFYQAGTGTLYPLEKLPIFQALQGQTAFVDDLEIHHHDRVISLAVQSIPVFDQRGTVLYAIAAFQDISERKRTETALREQEAQFRRIAESVPGMIYRYVLQANGQEKFSFVSPQCREVFEVEPETAVQNPQALWATVHPEDVPLIQSSIATSKQSLQPAFLEHRILTASGKIKWIQSHSCPVRLANGDIIWDGISVDATAQKEAAKLLEQYNYTLERQVQERTATLMQEIRDRQQIEAILREREAKLQAIVQAIPDLIFTANAEGIFLDYSRTQQFRDLVPPGLNPVGKSFAEILPTEITKRHLAALQQTLKTGELQTYEQKLLLNSRLQHEEVRVMKADADRVVFIVRDISDRKQAEAALQKAKNAAETANRAKSTFLASMSHELRTPLNAILGFAKIMSRYSATTAEQQRYLQIINQSGEHLLSLINSVLDLSKIEAGRMELLETRFHLLDLVETVIAMLHERAAAKGLQLHLQIASDIPPVAIADPGKLRQILINLIGNAIKFTDRGSVTLRVRRPRPNRLTFDIEDTGIGIAPQDLDRVFDAFTQANTGNTFTEGTGLGLPLCQKFVELMGGTLSVQSRFGQGSCFTVTLPIQWVDTPTVPLSPPSSEPRSIRLIPGQPAYRILIADDQPENRELLVKLLEPIGFQVQQATNGQEALDRWQTWQPDAILMDIQMPVMNGLNATQKIRAQEKTLNRRTPIIAITATTFKNDRDQATLAGCDAFLSKPFHEAELLKTLATHLGATYHDAALEPLQNLEPSNAVPSSIPDSVLFQQLPLEWKEKLYQITLSCDETQILQVLDQLPSEHRSLKPVIQTLAQQFEFDRILSLLERNSTE